MVVEKTGGGKRNEEDCYKTIAVDACGKQFAFRFFRLWGGAFRKVHVRSADVYVG